MFARNTRAGLNSDMRNILKENYILFFLWKKLAVVLYIHALLHEQEGSLSHLPVNARIADETG